ncbi:hypothetical protein GAYE_SCF28MG4747 [Galdieria yellowstonensis]|uniref:Uncharacterized protein n=1 Tax=Galdieria yellowstonensis TaxID=3028027 RepID=A0AAV9IHM5_9RHOD|nr:hypothetical protein GAYE_SCF28MG4747 [Galdieria yellowstonensis]
MQLEPKSFNIIVLAFQSTCLDKGIVILHGVQSQSIRHVNLSDLVLKEKMKLWRHFSWCLFLLSLLCCLSIISLAEDDPDTLQLREQSLLKQLKDVDLEAIEYRREIQLLKEEEKKVEAEYKRLKQARDWELKKMQEKEKQVEQLTESTNQKQQLVDTLVERIEENKREIEKLEKQLQELSEDKEYLEHRYYSPSLAEVLDEMSAKWDPLSRNMYVKAKTKLLPFVLNYNEKAKLYRQKWSRELTKTHKWVSFFLSCFIYGCIATIIFLLIAILRKLGRRLSVQKLLFLSDVTFTVFWMIILFASGIFWRDGFQALAENNEVLFLLLQLTVFTCYSGIIALRVFVFALSLSWQMLWELLLLLIVCQHYYIHLWQPSMTDNPLTATWKSYLFYYLSFQLLTWLKAARFGLMPSLSTLRMRGWTFAWKRGKNRLFMETDLTKQPFAVKYV